MNRILLTEENKNMNLSERQNIENTIDYKDYCVNFLHQPKIRIEHKYDSLITEAIKNNNFKKVVSALEKDFKNCFLLWRILEKISSLSKNLFSFNFKNKNAFKIIENIFIYKNLFLANLKYNPNIWLKLSVKQSEILNESSNYNNKFLLLLIDHFNPVEESFNLLYEWQKELLKLVLQSNNINDFINFKQKYNINIFSYLPINTLLLQTQMINLNSSESYNSRLKLAFSTYMQLICIFSEKNLCKKN